MHTPRCPISTLGPLKGLVQVFKKKVRAAEMGMHAMAFLGGVVVSVKDGS